MFITRVVLKNYKSIAACDVRLQALTFLVGPNGAGKSNFLDALRFVADALRTSLDHAMRERGGINEVRRRSKGHPNHFGLRLELNLPSGAVGHYAFTIGARPQAGFEVQHEECVLGLPGGQRHSYEVKRGSVSMPTVAAPPPAVSDRLYLVNAAGLPQFRPAYDGLSGMGFYSLNPDRIRDLQTPDSGEKLARDGSNIASVVRRLGEVDPPTKQRIVEYLGKIVGGVRGVEARSIPPRETLEFRQIVSGAGGDLWRFPAGSMSDGTLRALGILVAVFQARATAGVPLVGIEEPEVALHPAAVGVLLDSLRDASDSTQILVTSHSPDLLDTAEIKPEQILAVVSEDGVTRIGALDRAGRTVLLEQLYTPGELLRLDQLRPDAQEVPSSDLNQLRLFGNGFR